MKTPEQDELRRIEVAARQQSASAATRAAAALEAPAKAERDAIHHAGRPPLRRLFGGERGAVAILRSIPGFAGLWEKVVPDPFLREVDDRDGERWHVVSCMCGEHPALRPGSLAECPGDCGRWFFATGRSVRVRLFPQAAAA